MKTINYTRSSTDFYFDGTIAGLQSLAAPDSSFIITDEHILSHYRELFSAWKVITIPAGESSKSLAILADIIDQLMEFEADRDALIIGIGGGVVTDITGFVAGIYKRGVRCAFVPASILGMVDAAIGGKNGLDIGAFKNIIGLTRQPEFLLFDYTLPDTLPRAEWINGFAEIIKHACILDAHLFDLLESYKLEDFRSDKKLLGALVQQNALLKAGVVMEDEWETGKRKMLNFGHTLGHAIENNHQLPHGHAVAIGIMAAARISESITGFADTARVEALLTKYELPVSTDYDRGAALRYMLQDKKRKGANIHYVLLNRIGEAVIRPLSIEEISSFI